MDKTLVLLIRLKGSYLILIFYFWNYVPQAAIMKEMRRFQLFSYIIKFIDMYICGMQFA